jgi:hypothetical protein
MDKIELGDQVQDKITKLKGIVIGITYWLYGCTRMVIQSAEIKDGKPAETFALDEPQLLLIKKRVVPGVTITMNEKEAEKPEPKRRHGLRDDPRQGRELPR